MALNQGELQRLKNASLVSLYEKHKKFWDNMATEAYEYTRKYIKPPIKIRPDDVVKVLIPALTLANKFTDYTDSQRLRERYWTTWFADLILDRCWENNIVGG